MIQAELGKWGRRTNSSLPTERELLRLCGADMNSSLPTGRDSLRPRGTENVVHRSRFEFVLAYVAAAFRLPAFGFFLCPCL
jgi:hypothetical protein